MRDFSQNRYVSFITLHAWSMRIMWVYFAFAPIHTRYRSFMYALIHTYTHMYIRVPGATPEKLLYSIALTMKIYNDRGFSLAALSVVRTNAHWISADRHDTTTVSLGRQYETEWCAHFVRGAMAPPNENAHWSSAWSTAGSCDKTMRAQSDWLRTAELVFVLLCCLAGCLYAIILYYIHHYIVCPVVGASGSLYTS